MVLLVSTSYQVVPPLKVASKAMVKFAPPVASKANVNSEAWAKTRISSFKAVMLPPVYSTTLVNRLVSVTLTMAIIFYAFWWFWLLF